MSNKIKTHKKYPVQIKKSKTPNTFRISDVQVIVTHSPDKCKGNYCCIHNPSNHHMREWTMYWRDDTKVMERLCPEHGVGHPDPDETAYNIITNQAYKNVHGCCGCCHPTPVRLIDI